MIIYKITNKVNNKVYIGQTIMSINERWSNHKSCNNCVYLKNAIVKYGCENFTIEQIDSAETLEELNEKEKYWILFYNSTNRKKGYNLRTGGDNSLHSEESKQKMRKKRGPMTEEQKKNMKGKMTEEQKDRVRKIWVGKKHTEETKAKMRENKRLNPMSQEERDNISKRNKGKKHTEESKKKISEAQLGKKRPSPSEETKRKISESNKKTRELKILNSLKGDTNG